VATFYNRTRDSIEAHLTVVLAARAVSHWIAAQSDWSIKKFICTGSPLPRRHGPSR
jgi:hypothetical protein